MHRPWPSRPKVQKHLCTCAIDYFSPHHKVHSARQLSKQAQNGKWDSITTSILISPFVVQPSLHRGRLK